MGYALFAQRKLVLDSQLNCYELQQNQRSNEQYNLATRTTQLQSQLSRMSSSQSEELSVLYDQLVQASGSDQRESVNAMILAKQNQFEIENDAIQAQIDEVSLKENAIEMEVKHLDTRVTAIQKQLDAVQEAEGKAIDRATPKFSGLG